MERLIKIHIRKLPEGLFLVTSDDIQGLVAQGRTVIEAMEIARDVARKLLEAQQENFKNLISIKESFDYNLIIGVWIG